MPTLGKRKAESDPDVKAEADTETESGAREEVDITAAVSLAVGQADSAATEGTPLIVSPMTMGNGASTARAGGETDGSARNNDNTNTNNNNNNINSINNDNTNNNNADDAILPANTGELTAGGADGADAPVQDPPALDAIVIHPNSEKMTTMQPPAKRTRRSKPDESSDTYGAFNDMLFQLLQYKAVHGDFRVKGKDPEVKTLHQWILYVRRAYKLFQEHECLSTLTSEQVRVLNFLQFPWNTRGEEHWSRNYESLKEFREKHGHTMVPRTYHEVQNLCHWVTDQRRQFKNLAQGKPSTMTKDRQKLLDSIGFVWQVRNRTTWDTRFQELLEFKEARGTTIVPQHFAENRALGKWVSVCKCVCACVRCS